MGTYHVPNSGGWAANNFSSVELMVQYVCGKMNTMLDGDQ